MIRPLLSIAAQLVIRDAQSSTISLINISETIQAEGFPVFIPQIAFLVMWERETADPSVVSGEFTVEIDGTRLQTLVIHLDSRTIYEIEQL